MNNEYSKFWYLTYLHPSWAWLMIFLKAGRTTTLPGNHSSTRRTPSKLVPVRKFDVTVNHEIRWINWAHYLILKIRILKPFSVIRPLNSQCCMEFLSVREIRALFTRVAKPSLIAFRDGLGTKYDLRVKTWRYFTKILAELFAF